MTEMTAVIGDFARKGIANVNCFDPSLTDSEWKRLAATVGLT